MDALQTTFTATYKQQAFTTWKVAGQSTGQYKNAGTLSYIRVAGAGHEVRAYFFSMIPVKITADP